MRTSFRPSLILVIALAVLASCGEESQETLGRRVPSPILDQEPSMLHVAPERMDLGRPERETVQCPPERIQTPECKIATPTPRPAPRRVEPAPEPLEPETHPTQPEDIYAGLEPLPALEPLAEEDAPMAEWPPPSVRRYEIPRVAAAPSPKPPAPVAAAEGPSFSKVALGVGAAGMGISALGVVIAAEDPTQDTLILSGVVVGLGIATMAAGGITAVIEQSSSDTSHDARGSPAPTTTVSIGPGSISIIGSF